VRGDVSPRDVVLSYEVWDTRTANRLASFATEVDALRWLQEWLATAPISALANVALLRERGDAHVQMVATGKQLAELAAAQSV
jgi:hypothetical protein